MLPLSLVVCSFFALAIATDVQQCPGHSNSDLKDNVLLTPCKRSVCRLKKGTSTNISITFTPDKDIDEVTNHVTAEVFGVPLPFVGVDGNSICDKMETEAGEKASCPLKGGTKYVYKDSFPILSFYPTIEVRVHWALVESNKEFLCFEMPAKIVK